MVDIEFKDNQRVFVTGKTGSGKSYFVKAIMPKFKRVIFIDWKYEHEKLFRRNGTYDLKDVENFLYDKKVGVLTYRPRDLGVDEFNELCKLVYKYGNCTLVVDECQQYVSPYEMPSWHEHIMCRGRIRNIGCWNLTQNPTRGANNTLISESEHIVIFKLSVASDRDKIKGIVGKEWAERIRTLPEYHYVYFNERLSLCEQMPPI